MNKCLWLFLLVCLPLAAPAQPRPNGGAVAAAHPLATAAGVSVLRNGGNAFDAAVAVAATLAVVEPYGSGLGGGGFWLLHQAESDRDVMVDAREKAPKAATRTLYQDASGEVVPGLSMNGGLAAGVPGVPAVLVHVAARYGRLPLARSLAPAIRHAREGFSVTPYFRRVARFRLDTLRADPRMAALFLRDGELPAVGTVIRQPELAATLQRLADHGNDGFYGGETARRLVDGVRARGGIWSLADLAEYSVVEREPIRFAYHGYEVVSAPPPSSGGVALATMLNILSAYDLSSMAPAVRRHLVIEAMRRAYHDRARYLGDPDYVDVPVARLADPVYAAGLRADLRLDRALPSAALSPVSAVEEGTNTTHFSVLDGDGNYAAVTQSLNYPFGAGVMPEGTGVVLNNEMDDFSAKPGVPNVYGLVGAEANAIAPGKRMLSSMTPTFVRDDLRVAVLGTPGGSRIISMVLLGILDFVDGHGPQSWVSLPRYHHQYLPDVVQFEPGAIAEEQQSQLQAMGHHLQALRSDYGGMQALMWDRRDGHVEAASDPRLEGTAAVITAPPLPAPVVE